MTNSTVDRLRSKSGNDARANYASRARPRTQPSGPVVSLEATRPRCVRPRAPTLHKLPTVRRDDLIRHRPPSSGPVTPQKLRSVPRLKRTIHLHPAAIRSVRSPPGAFTVAVGFPGAPVAATPQNIRRGSVLAKRRVVPTVVNAQDRRDELRGRS